MVGGIVLIVALVAVGALVALYAMRQRKLDDPAVLTRFNELPGFKITDKHIQAGTGIAIDEEHAKVAVVVPGLPHAAVLTPRDMARWLVRTTDDGRFFLQINSRRHEKPLQVAFPDQESAESWVGLLQVLTEEH